MIPPDDPPEPYVPPFDPAAFASSPFARLGASGDGDASGESPESDAGDAANAALAALANARMPFGKYAGTLLVDLPESYVLWFKGKGYPDGPLGDRLRAIEEIKVNGLEFLLRPLIER
jgi:uncharacterized protein (DUF3820 family)